jgi:uncharacterized delta-60 repeat protein
MKYRCPSFKPMMIYGWNAIMSTQTETAGSPDPKFGTTEDGYVFTKTPQPPMYSKILSDGSFVTLSHSFESGKACLIKHSADGIYDEQFGVVITEKIGDLENFTARNSLITEDDKIILLGSITPNTGPHTALLARFFPNGDLDKSFGTDGLTLINYPAYPGMYESRLSQQPDGKIIVVLQDGPNNGRVIRINKLGVPDSPFGQAGVIETSFDPCVARGQSDGAVIVAGANRDRNSEWSATIARYNNFGALDTRFGTDGYLKLYFGEDEAPSVLDCAIQADGHIIAVGFVNRGSGGRKSFIARITPLGQLDTTFNNGEPVITDGFDFIEATAIQADGKIVTLARSPKGEYVHLLRHSSNGEWDPTFGEGGVAFVYNDPQGRPESIALQTLELQPDGKIVISGYGQSTVIGRFLA